MVGLCRRCVTPGLLLAPLVLFRGIGLFIAQLRRHLRVGWLGCAGRHKKRSQLGLQLTPTQRDCVLVYLKRQLSF